MIYLDNAATSYPKPETVPAAITECLLKEGANPGRSSHHMAVSASRTIYSARKKLAELLGVPRAADVFFTFSATDSINMALKGFLQPGDHVVTSSLEHNAVARTLAHMESERQLHVTKVATDPDEGPDPERLSQAMRPDTKLVVCTHASNVTGVIAPIEAIAEVAHRAGARLMVDAAQTAGSIPINVESQGVDILAVTGHKALLGPQGVGALYAHPDLELWELRQGGTGGDSALAQPTTRPDRYEAGTPNTPGIAGLAAALEYLLALGADAIREREVVLTAYLLDKLAGLRDIEIYGPAAAERRVPLVSFNLQHRNPHAVAMELDKRFDIAVRAGLHCAPDAHESMGTSKNGAVRAGLSIFNTTEDIDALCEALGELRG